jgi:hypothetical protein
MKNILEFVKYVFEHPTTGISLDPFGEVQLHFYNVDGRDTNPYPSLFSVMGIKDYQESCSGLGGVTYSLPISILRVPNFLLEEEQEVFKLLFYCARNVQRIGENFEIFDVHYLPGHLPQVRYQIYRDLFMGDKDKEAFKRARGFITNLLLEFPQLEESKTTISVLEDIGPVEVEIDLLTLP